MALQPLPVCWSKLSGKRMHSASTHMSEHISNNIREDQNMTDACAHKIYICLSTLPLSKLMPSLHFLEQIQRGITNEQWQISINWEWQNIASKNSKN